MKLLSTLFGASMVVLFPLVSVAQSVTVTTGIPSSATTLTAVGQTPGITFVVINNNNYPMVLDDMSVYRDAASSGKTWTLYYSATSLSGPSAINTAAGWTQIATTTAPAASSTGIHPVFTNINFQIPGNTTYRFYVCHSGDVFNYGSAASTPNNFSSGGMTIATGNYQISGQNVGHAGYSASLSTAFVPRFFGGTLTFDPGSANNLHGMAITSPAGNSDNCHGADLPIRVKIQNTGSAPQSNFPVGASYTGPANGSVTGMYTGTLAPGAIDSIDLGPLNLQPGNYVVKAYTMLATDTLNLNDTTGSVSFLIKQPVPLPVTLSDTVCVGENATMAVVTVQGAQYRWYSGSSGGTPVFIGNSLSFNPLSADTTLYIACLENGCESARVPVHVAIGPAPVVNLGSDTSFCESIPLVLDGGNPGGVYTWSTGDSTQSITVTNVSGTYWVSVDKYCVRSDTVVVDIAPMPHVNGISYVRISDVYHFSPTNPQNVDSYFWIFGDGSTSTLSNPVHDYADEIDVDMHVRLIVTNNCGSDTVQRFVTTPVQGVEGLSGDIIVYPNPARDQVRIQAEGSRLTAAEVYDVTGRLLGKHSANNSSSITLTVNHLAAGNYVLRIFTDKGQEQRLVQVKH